jgi:hypothetical protein
MSAARINHTELDRIGLALAKMLHAKWTRRNGNALADQTRAAEAQEGACDATTRRRS